jgi:phospholipid/cholesterol/gamma-HCH transport system ATP-binding protein
MADVIDQLIRELQRRMGVTSIAVTHDMGSAFKIGDRIAMLMEGRIIFSGTPGEMRDSRDPVVRQFLEGTSDGPIQPV